MLFNEPRAKEIMKKYGLDALIATMPENITYMADYPHQDLYNYRGLKAYAIYTGDGEGVLVIPISELAFAIETKPWIQDIRTYGTFFLQTNENNDLAFPDSELLREYKQREMGEDVVKVLKGVVREKKLEKAVIGWDTGNISAPAVRQELEREFPGATFVDAFNVFREIRMVKTNAELELIRTGIAINEKGLSKVFQSLREGVTEEELYRSYLTTVVAEGAYPGFWSAGAGKRSGALYSISDYALQKGDLFRFDAGCTYHHYWTDMGRTAVLGEPSEKQVKLYNAICAGYRAALEIIRPGTRVSQIFEVMVQAIRDNGVPSYQRHHLGHSTGIEFYEPPMIIPANKSSDIFLSGTQELVLEENMIINIEAPYYEPGFGGLQIEDTVLVTKDGFEFLTTFPRELHVARCE